MSACCMQARLNLLGQNQGVFQTLFHVNDANIVLDSAFELHMLLQYRLTKHTQRTQCSFTIVYSFHCTIWWLAHLRPPSITVSCSCFVYIFLPPLANSWCCASRTEKEAGDFADVWPKCLSDQWLVLWAIQQGLSQLFSNYN